MSSIVQRLYNNRELNCPRWLPGQIQYEVMMGSIAYGVSSDLSDTDIYGFCIPHKDTIFPHLRGEINGFGQPTERFDQYQQHHVKSRDNGREYDISIYNIVRYFQLCMENNPNMIDSLFVPSRCVLFSSKIANMVRDKKRIFLHKGAWHKFKGYAYSQMHKMDNKNPVGKRLEAVNKFGYDVKFAYHLVRLLNEIEMILTECNLDLERNNEQLKSIRRGDWTQEEVRNYFFAKEKSLEELYTISKLQHSPDEEQIKQLLLDCLEEHFGSLGNCIVEPDKAIETLRQINELIRKSNII